MTYDLKQQHDIAEYLKSLHTIYGLDIIVSVCMVCGRYLGVKDGGGNHGVSHGICPECAIKMKREMKL